MSFSNPLSLYLGDVEKKHGDVIANPDNLPLSLQQRYLMARANNLFDENFTIHNFRDTTTGMDLARELNENFKALATPHAISKWRPVLKSDILPRDVQEVGSFPYYLASEVYGLTSKERNTPVHLSKKFNVQNPWSNLPKKPQEVRSKTTDTSVQTLTSPADDKINTRNDSIGIVTKAEDSSEILPTKNQEIHDNDDNGDDSTSLRESIIGSQNFEQAKKEGRVLFLNVVDGEIVEYFLTVLSQANDQGISSFAKFLTKPIGQWYLTSNYIQIEIQPVFGRIHFANKETDQNLLEFLSTAVLDTEKKLLRNPLIYNDSYIDFTAFVRNYELFDDDYDMNFQPLVRYLIAIYNNSTCDEGESGNVIQLRHSVLKSQHTFLQKLYEKDFYNYFLYVVKLFDKLTEDTPFVLRADSIETSGIKEIFDGLFLLLPQFQQARQKCLEIVNLITPDFVRRTDSYKNNVDAILPEAKSLFPNYIENTEAFLELLQYCFCSYYTFPNSERQPVEHIFRGIDNLFFEEFIAIGLDLELNSTPVGRAVAQCFTTLYYMYFTLAVVHENGNAVTDANYRQAIYEFKELLNPKLLSESSSSGRSLKLEQLFGLFYNFNDFFEVISNQEQDAYIDDELKQQISHQPVTSDAIEITQVVEPEYQHFLQAVPNGENTFITPTPSVMSVDVSQSSDDDSRDPFNSDLEMDNVSFDGYDGTVLRSISHRDADLLYNALNADPPTNMEYYDDGYEGHVVSSINGNNSDIEIDSSDNMSLDDSYTSRNVLPSAQNEYTFSGFDDGYDMNLNQNVPMHDLSYAQAMSLPDGDNVDDLLDSSDEYEADDGYDNTVLNAFDSYNRELLEAALNAEDQTEGLEFDDGYDGTLFRNLDREHENEVDKFDDDDSNNESLDDGYDGTVLPLLHTDRNEDFDDGSTLTAEHPTESLEFDDGNLEREHENEVDEYDDVDGNSENFADGYDGTVLPLLRTSRNEDFDDGYDGTVLPRLNSLGQEIPTEIPSREEVEEYLSTRIDPQHRFDILHEIQDALRYGNTGRQQANDVNASDNILRTLATANVITDQEHAAVQRRRQQRQNRRH